MAPPSTASAPDIPLTRSRWAVMAQFVLFGTIVVAWMSRMPAVRDALDVSAVQLGSLLIAGGIGALTGALTVGALIARFGARRVLLVGTIGNVLGFALLALATAAGGFEVFAVGSVLNGWCGALVNVPINVSGAAIERRLGRTVLPQFHAGFSIGAALGAVIAAGFAWAGIGISWQLLIVTAVVTVLRAVTFAAATAPTMQPDASSSSSRTRAAPRPTARPRGLAAVRSALAAWREPYTLLLGVVLMAASLAEGTAAEWLAIAVVDGFGEVEAIGAIVFGTFVLSMTVFRFIGARLIDRFGRVAILRASGFAALAGVALFVFAPALWAAWIGVALWGCGTALGNPIAIAAASDDPERAGQRVPVVTAFSTIASLAAPPLLGLLVDQVGARWATLVVAGVVLVSLAAAGRVRRRPDTAQAVPASEETIRPASRSASPTTAATRD